MAIQLGSAYGKVSIDGSGVRGGVNEATGSLESFKTKMEDIGGKMQNVGQKMSLALTLPIILAGKKMVDAANNLEETKNKINVLFGEMSDEMLAWSADAATAIGQSQQAALDGAADMGIFGSAAGLAGDDLAQFSQENVELASDLASFFNTSPEEAILALGAAYRGESEPIRKYGVLINQAAVEAKALELGLMKEGEELSQQNRILAVNALIMDHTTAAQGDFARTSDGLANQQRILKAELENSAAALGQQLLPYALKGVNILRSLLERFRNLSPQMQKTILVILAVVAAIGPLLVVLGSVVSAIGTIAPIIGAVGTAISGIGLPILAVIALVALLFAAWKNNWGGIQEKTGAAIAAIKLWWETVLLPALQKVWAWMSSVLFPFFQALGRFLGAVFGVAVRALAGLWQNVLLPAIQKAVNWITANVMPKLRPVADFFKNTLGKAFQWVTDRIKELTEFLNKLAAGLTNIELPWWLTPGSPTPWEMGLRGINRQIRTLSRARLPELALGMNRLPMPAVSPAGAGQSANAQNWQQRVLIYNAQFNAPRDMQDTNWLRSLNG